MQKNNAKVSLISIVFSKDFQELVKYIDSNDRLIEDLSEINEDIIQRKEIEANV